MNPRSSVLLKFLLLPSQQREGRRREMQWRPPDPPQSANPNPNFLPNRSAADTAAPSSMFHRLNPTPCAPPQGIGHRRARSELAFRVPEDLDRCSGDFFAVGGADEVGSEDDLFCTFMEVEQVEGSGSASEVGVWRDWSAENVEDRKISDAAGAAPSRPKHRHSVSVDGSSMLSSVPLMGEEVFAEAIEAKKAMTSEQLAELAAVDPKKAKRCLIFVR